MQITMAKNYFKIILAIFFLFSAGFVDAREPQDITDWYIENLETNIVVNKDSSLLITENITADCGNLPEKHGIFRVLPIEIKTDKGVFKTPIELISITDFDNNSYNYQTIKNRFDKTVTWKIGDADKTVSGKNYYRIVYKVNNAVRFFNSDFDELYWNLLGTFWQIDIDSFSAKIVFPSEITKQNTIIDYYTGFFGSKDKSLAEYNWIDNATLIFKSTSTLKAGQGITVSMAFPKNIFEPYQFTFFEKYGKYFLYLFFLLPIIAFVFSFKIWKKHGKDPKMRMPIPPEFGIPENITPIQMGMVISSGRWNNQLITATIIDLAVRGFIAIKESEDKILFLKYKEIELIKNESTDVQKLTDTEKIILDKLFNNQTSIKLSGLKNEFYKEINDIKKSAENDAVNQGWVVKNSFFNSIIFIFSGFLVLFFSFSVSLAFVSFPLFLSLLLTGIIILIFGLIMPKRTQVGTDLIFKIKGFKLYMKKAEDYRQQFYEKENIFDKFLPYAIVFGIAGLWAKKMQLIYGEEYFKNYHPIWFVGSSHSNFDLDSFNSQLNSITSSISSATYGSSGAGGSGGAGGGGGGGGGGGW